MISGDPSQLTRSRARARIQADEFHCPCSGIVNNMVSNEFIFIRNLD